MNHRGVQRRFVVISWFAVPAIAMLAVAAPDASAQSFPFGRELRLDVNPMPGSKKVPVLDIGDRGVAEIDLWCGSVKAQLVVAANTITIITGEKSSQPCAPDRVPADDELLAALNQATNWRMENSALVFTGGKTLRFRLQTN